MSNQITKVEILELELLFKGDVIGKEIDLGALTMKREGREYIWDAMSSNWSLDEDEGTTSISLSMERVDELEGSYDLEPWEMLSDDTDIYFYYGSDDDEVGEAIYATLILKAYNSDSTPSVKVIEFYPLKDDDDTPCKRISK